MIHSTPQSPSHSRLSCLHHCSRKYWHRYVCDYEDDAAVVAALVMGKVGHAGLDAYYRDADPRTAMSNAWGNNAFYGDDSWLTLGHMILRIEKYISRDSAAWKPILLQKDQILWDNVLEHEAKWDAAGNLVLAESKFRLSLGSGLSVVVVPDLIIEHRFDDELVPVVIDNKFRIGWINDKQRSEMEVGHQLRMYALAYEALTGICCRDGWMNNIFAGKNCNNPKSKAKMYQLSMFGPWNEEQMQATMDWIKSGRNDAEMYEQPGLDKFNFTQNPGQHCHYCEFKEECIG